MPQNHLGFLEKLEYQLFDARESLIFIWNSNIVIFFKDSFNLLKVMLNYKEMISLRFALK